MKCHMPILYLMTAIRRVSLLTFKGHRYGLSSRYISMVDSYACHSSVSGLNFVISVVSIALWNVKYIIKYLCSNSLHSGFGIFILQPYRICQVHFYLCVTLILGVVCVRWPACRGLCVTV